MCYMKLQTSCALKINKQEIKKIFFWKVKKGYSDGLWYSSSQKSNEKWEIPLLILSLIPSLNSMLLEWDGIVEG